MARIVLFIVGSCLAVLSAIYSAQHPIQAERFMWALWEVDGRVLLLMLPFALAIAAAVSVFFRWKLFRNRRTAAKRRSKQLAASNSQAEALGLVSEGVVNCLLFYELQRQEDASSVAWTRSTLRGLMADVDAGCELSVFVPNRQHPLSIRTPSEFNEWVARHFSWFLAEIRD